MLGLILAGVLLCVGFYYYGIRPMSFWKKKGVKQGNPVWVIGDNLDVLLGRESMPDSVIRFYKQHSSERYSGIYALRLPILVIKDLELIKKIGVKDFDNFVDHKSFVSDNSNPLWSKNLFALKGRQWKEMRSILSPCFTSSKMKAIFLLMSDVAETFVDYFKNQNEDEIIEVDMKDICTRYGNDVISSVVFGVETNSLVDRNNEFYAMGKELTSVNGFWKILKAIGYSLAPKLFDFLGVSMFNKEVTNFFTDLVDETIRLREEKGIVRQDMINLLLEARRGGKKREEMVDPLNQFPNSEKKNHGKGSELNKNEITNMDITAHAMIFFIAGFDSITNVMAFMACELATNPDIQSRLRDEIESTQQQCDGKLTYEALMQMKYMDMIVSETLRKWPPFVAIDRLCTKPYTIEPASPTEKSLHIEKDTSIWFPIFGLHYDPKYYPEPERFDPERFSDANKHKINPLAYIPFGVGPRNCIASRFALMECKILFYHLLLKFELVPVKKSNLPIKIAKSVFSLKAEGGYWLGLKHISK